MSFAVSVRKYQESLVESFNKSFDSDKYLYNPFPKFKTREEYKKHQESLKLFLLETFL